MSVGKYPLLRFVEPAVIIATESRISDANGRILTDRGQKTFVLSDFAIAGFSGDVQIASCALNNLMAELARLRIKPTNVVGRAEVLLKGEWNYRRRHKWATNILIAVRYQKERIRLFKLASENQFKPRRVEPGKTYGVEAVGSGAKEFESAFEYEMSPKIKAWQRRALARNAFPRSPFHVYGTTSFYDDDPTVVPVDPTVAYDVTWELISTEIVSAISETLDKTNLKSIGGKIQCLTLDSRRASRTRAYMSSDNGETWNVITLDHGEFENLDPQKVPGAQGLEKDGCASRGNQT